STIAHLGALDEVYVGVITAHREAATATEELDDVTNDLLVGHLHELELFHWFIRAHLESTRGDLSTEGASTEKGAARKAEEAATGQPCHEPLPCRPSAGRGREGAVTHRRGGPSWSVPDGEVSAVVMMWMKCLAHYFFRKTTRVGA